MLKVEYTGLFRQKLRKLLEEQPKLRVTVQERTALFRTNPNDTRLANHALRKRLLDKWAFSITDDIRIVYCFMGKKTVRFLAIGTHATVYKKN